MSDPKAKLILRLCLFTFIYLTVTDCRLLPVTKSSVKRAFEKKHQLVLPEDFLQKYQNYPANLKIPNQEFCTEMILEPEDHYLVLPWWYNYCQDLRDKHTKGIQGNVNYDTIHKYILAEVQQYKKRLNQKKNTLSELEKILVR